MNALYFLSFSKYYGNSMGVCRNFWLTQYVALFAHTGHTVFVRTGRTVFAFLQRLFPVSDHHSEDVICGITGTGSDGLQATSCS